MRCFFFLKQLAFSTLFHLFSRLQSLIPLSLSLSKSFTLLLSSYSLLPSLDIDHSLTSSLDQFHEWIDTKKESTLLENPIAI
ncbi:hypothetical protein DFH27DRAFT_543043 [Peziza echinospora]|nr:hypothetical protein DFH27DRAFT_543043 [Peziza echinospora]